MKVSYFAYPGLTADMQHPEILSLNLANPETRANLDNFVREVCEALGISYDLFVSKYRGQDIVPFRQVFCYLLFQKRISLKVIGRIVGHRDHSTVIHANKKVEFALENDLHDPNINQAYKMFKKDEVQMIIHKYLHAVKPRKKPVK